MAPLVDSASAASQAPSGPFYVSAPYPSASGAYLAMSAPYPASSANSHNQAQNHIVMARPSIELTSSGSLDARSSARQASGEAPPATAAPGAMATAHDYSVSKMADFINTHKLAQQRPVYGAAQGAQPRNGRPGGTDRDGKWVQPSGPRRPGEGTENEEQGIVAADTTPGGLVLRITLLAAGFVIGPSGCSVRDIMRVSGADIKSWTEASGARSRRPCRVLVLEGDERAVVDAAHVVTAAVDRYKDLCEGKHTGQSVSRIQRIMGVDFTYQPPPRSVVPCAAALKGQTPGGPVQPPNANGSRPDRHSADDYHHLLAGHAGGGGSYPAAAMVPGLPPMAYAPADPYGLAPYMAMPPSPGGVDPYGYRGMPMPSGYPQDFPGQPHSARLGGQHYPPPRRHTTGGDMPGPGATADAAADSAAARRFMTHMAPAPPGMDPSGGMVPMPLAPGSPVAMVGGMPGDPGSMAALQDYLMKTGSYMPSGPGMVPMDMSGLGGGYMPMDMQAAYMGLMAGQAAGTMAPYMNLAGMYFPTALPGAPMNPAAAYGMPASPGRPSQGYQGPASPGSKLNPQAAPWGAAHAAAAPGGPGMEHHGVMGGREAPDRSLANKTPKRAFKAQLHMAANLARLSAMQARLGDTASDQDIPATGPARDTRAPGRLSPADLAAGQGGSSGPGAGEGVPEGAGLVSSGDPLVSPSRFGGGKGRRKGPRSPVSPESTGITQHLAALPDLFNAKFAVDDPPAVDQHPAQHDAPAMPVPVPVPVVAAAEQRMSHASSM